MSAPAHLDDMDLDYSAARIRDRRESEFESRRQPKPRYQSTRRAPSQVNGIHRRRNKRFAW